MASFDFIKVEVEQKTLDDVKFMLASVEGGAAKAIIRASNDTAVTGRSRIVDKTFARLHLKKARVRENTSVFKTNNLNIGARAVIFKRPIPLIEFPHITSFVGLSVEVRKNKGPDFFRHRFKAQMRSGHVDLFERALRNGEPVGRLPIDKTWGPSIGNVFHHNDEEELFKELMLLFQKRVMARAEFILKSS